MRRSTWVELLQEQTGSPWAHLGDAQHGETAGACFVGGPDGVVRVLTAATVSAARMRQTAQVLASAKAAGLPVPLHERVLEGGDGLVLVVQERLPGSPAGVVDVEVLDAIVAVNDRFAGALADHRSVPAVRLSWVPAAGDLHDAGQWDERFEVVRGHSRQARRVVAAAQDLGAGAGVGASDVAGGEDLVHPDLTVPNVLFDSDGRISGVVDWNGGALRGDRHFALVKLLFDTTWDAACPQGAERVRAGALDYLEGVLRARVEPGVLARYWMHWALRALWWGIQHRDQVSIDVHLNLAERL